MDWPSVFAVAGVFGIIDYGVGLGRFTPMALGFIFGLAWYKFWQDRRLRDAD